MRAAIIAMLVLAGCTTSSPPDVAENEYELSIEANDAARRFDIEVVSLSSRPLCFQRQQWPTEEGGIDDGSDWVFVEADGTRFPIEAEGGDLCAFSTAVSCRVILRDHGDRLRAFISYAKFSPEAFRTGTPRLIFDPRPHECSRGELQ